MIVLNLFGFVLAAVWPKTAAHVKSIQHGDFRQRAHSQILAMDKELSWPEKISEWWHDSFPDQTSGVGRCRRGVDLHLANGPAR
jgi:hypothetical protein